MATQQIDNTHTHSHSTKPHPQHRLSPAPQVGLNALYTTGEAPELTLNPPRNLRTVVPHEVSFGPVTLAGADPSALLPGVQAAVTLAQKYAGGYPRKILIFLDDTACELGTTWPSSEDLVIFNSESPRLAALAEKLPGKIRWFSLRDPATYLERLLDRYEGTYFTLQRNELVYSSSSTFESYPLSSAESATPSLLLGVLLAREWGVPREFVQKAISDTVNQWG
jgi:hypothetical protein